MKPKRFAATSGISPARGGISLILVIFLITVLLVLGSALTRLAVGSRHLAENKQATLAAFYLAEDGIEKIKTELSKNPNWYTDLPHSPPDDINWLKGKTIVREYNKNRAYAVGVSKKAVRIIKIEFEPVPFKQTLWKLL
ncbi:hypothetical protein A2276_00405 [candidate division WOR-1 bacterium RIFOXYA12_FULL_43_27]|uniref:Type 4 fimbrial biogenesis protein PilX N-terminal domain-containing protein n=1 Tax=candidate division WOR-1 bacterium RIFOXYC2_FULL_46_14 TaxID=1802587 RepID=A0A1F4U4G1_UNCSA|nr:MAG: hypothetical protein A2276_00405 [candidate division WOR-1 bacterium RIFOXYA12_FULL_43_27]OGC20843.1 MAG: hypothetical protein A2292_07470 [candidate division WOR-1 bacterium RIFOXYB2_FULL_46_45]OGC31420.1 MAG: hypothetical protein A2232_03980 [candidate division WOR-1 bacterium RIFOXYA2_FULL_46_56]OGC39826.1 MAG: hypothetical protein A2438_04815 [candidate division WOR-1 bacterium RIFOXYC2_FULL_46_14]